MEAKPTMAKLLLKKKVAGRAPPPPKALTIEEVRERFPLGTFERAVGELKVLAGFKEIAREHKNAENRQKTQGGKAMKAMLADDIIALGDEIQIGDQAFSYDFATSETIDRKALYDMVKAGDVKVEDLIKCINVNKDMASKIIGDHILMGITSTEKGKKADIRIRDLDKPVTEPKLVRKPPAAPPKKRIDRTTDDKPAERVVGSGSLRRPRRLVRVR
jgi:hypothetical protein